MTKMWLVRMIILTLVIVMGLFPTIAGAQQAGDNKQDTTQISGGETGNSEVGESSLDEDAVPTATTWTAVVMVTGFFFAGVWMLRKRALG